MFSLSAQGVPLTIIEEAIIISCETNHKMSAESRGS